MRRVMNALASFISDQLKEQQSDLAAAVVHPLWRKASAFAATAHGLVGDDHRVPEALAHATRVAVMISALFRCQDMNVLVTALLHNVLEEAGVSFEELEEHFGRLVASRVERLTRDPEVDDFVHVKRLQACDWQTRLVTLADAVDHVSEARQEDDACLSWAISALDLGFGFEQPLQRAQRHLIELLGEMGALNFTHPESGADEFSTSVRIRSNSSSSHSEHLPAARWVRG